ncbi:MAG: sulfotransferase domain-containing protein [Acidimicrobiia bacterium]|nr:sulfotransferase domain-containing protein [Acidimicrobiia bacterium]
MIDLAGPQPPHPLPDLSPYGGPVRKRHGAADQAKGQILEATRRFGAATSSLRAKPDYMIIGTKRGGSTSLARWVLEHPQVASLFPARETRKGTYYFDVNYGRGVHWYGSHFPTAASLKAASKIVGEAVPYYLYHPLAPVRARAHAPSAKIIALLRNPIDRAFGHWGERTRNGVEWLPFPDALDAEDVRIAGEEERIIAEPGYVSFAHQHYSYVDQGRYERGLSRWMHHWPAHQLLILRSEDMYDDPESIYRQVTDFLELDPFSPTEFTAWNKRAGSPLPAGQHDRLHEVLAPSITATEELLGRQLGWE